MEDRLDYEGYLGSTLRGAFGHVLRRIVCSTQRDDCQRCLLKSSCAYAYIFETPIPPEAEIMRLYRQAPHPFVIDMPFSRRVSYAPGDTLAFGLTLIGKGVEFLPYFIYAFQELGKIGLTRACARFTLISANSLDGRGSEVPIWEHADSRLRATPYMLTDSLFVGESPVAPLTLDFLTPTRIKLEGALATELPFALLVRTLFRRVSALSYFHCGRRIAPLSKSLLTEADAVSCVSSNLRWEDWERFSARQQSRMKLGGFIGSVVYSGNIAPFWPLVRLGQFIHVGKATAFGLGKYSIQRDAP